MSVMETAPKPAMTANIQKGVTAVRASDVAHQKASTTTSTGTAWRNTETHRPMEMRCHRSTSSSRSGRASGGISLRSNWASSTSTRFSQTLRRMRRTPGIRYTTPPSTRVRVRHSKEIHTASKNVHQPQKNERFTNSVRVMMSRVADDYDTDAKSSSGGLAQELMGTC